MQAQLDLSKCSERDKKIVEMYLNGVATKVIAEQLGIDRSTIYRVLRRCGIEPSRKTRRSREISEEEEREIIEEYKRGVPVKEILEKHGISATKLYSILQKYGLEKRSGRRKGGHRRPVSDEEAKRIVELYKSGMPVYRIAKLLGRAPSTIYSVLRRMGVFKG